MIYIPTRKKCSIHNNSAPIVLNFTMQVFMKNYFDDEDSSDSVQILLVLGAGFQPNTFLCHNDFFLQKFTPVFCAMKHGSYKT